MSRARRDRDDRDDGAAGEGAPRTRSRLPQGRVLALKLALTLQVEHSELAAFGQEKLPPPSRALLAELEPGGRLERGVTA
jgi:hypothetical protein